MENIRTTKECVTESSARSLSEGKALGMKDKAKTERQFFISSIMELVNSERIGTKYKQLSYPFFATKLQGVPDEDIREFFFTLQRAENRGAAGMIFFARTRV